MTTVRQPTKRRRSCVLTLKYTFICVYWWTRQRIHNTLIVVDRYLRLMGDKAEPRLESFYPPFVAGIDLPHQGVVDSYNLLHYYPWFINHPFSLYTSLLAHEASLVGRESGEHCMCGLDPCQGWHHIQLIIDRHMKSEGWIDFSVPKGHLRTCVSSLNPFQYKICVCRYREFHYKDKTVVRPSYLYNGNS